MLLVAAPILVTCEQQRFFRDTRQTDREDRTARRTGRDTVRLRALAHRTGFGVKRSGADTAGFVLCLNGHLRVRLPF